MSDIYSTQFLGKAVEALIRAQAALLDMFFPVIQVSDSEEIKFDTKDGKRRLAPFVSPVVAGKIVAGLGKKTNTFTPAYVKDKRVLQPKGALKRLAGEKIGGTLAPAQRRLLILKDEMTDQTDMLTRRQEVMAAEILLSGKVTVEGEGFDTQVVDFGRDDALTLTLGTGLKWGDTGVSPLSDAEDWTETMLELSGAVATDFVFDTKAWALYRKDPTFKDSIDKTLGAPDSVTIASMAKLGMSYKGAIDNVWHWVYSDWYEDNEGVSHKIIPDYTVIVGSRNMEGVRHFGAILDEEAGIQAKEHFTKSWVEKDPSLRILLMQSAPLVVPYRPNASMSVTVK